MGLSLFLSAHHGSHVHDSIRLQSCRIRVLGAAAGGGFPQWNCNCRNCDGVRKGTIRAQPRTQSSIAVSADGVDWVLFNASPDLLAQIKSFPALQPARAIRDTGIRAVVLMDGQIDHTTGLLMLREGKPLELWCTDMVREDLSTGNPLFNILGHYCTRKLAPPADRAREQFRYRRHRPLELQRRGAQEQGPALLATSKQSARRRQHRYADHGSANRKARLLRSRAG